MKSVQGKIIKGIAGFYYVACEGEIYSCKAKGAFRNQKIKPLVGDDVLFDITDKEKQIGNIVELLPRKNSLIRPAVSNVDQAVVVLAFTHPDPQLYLLDKYLIMMSRQNVEIAILWNKADIASKTDRLRANIYQDAGFFTMQMSVASGEGIDDFRSYLRGKSSVLAGPSGVGKSSLTNILCPMALMQTQDISKKISRGRHTTRHSEFFYVEENTYICDTPGFTSVNIEDLPKEALRSYYPEFEKYEGKCRFHGCVHIAEPDCCVKEALHRGEISKIRYENYVKIYKELESVRKY